MRNRNAHYLNLPINISISKPDGSPKGTIQYVYDGSGQKMKKIVTELGTGVNGANKVTTTTYWSSFVFEEVNDGAVTPVMKLQFAGFEEGRARLVTSPSTQQESFVLDYMIKDHLGNVRALITEEEKTQVYLATMESNVASQENEIFARLDQTRIAINQIDPYYTPDNVMPPGDKVAKVIADDKKIGPALTLRVMAGDKVNLRVHSWYKMPGSDPGNDPDMIGADLLSIMSLGIGGQNAVLGETPNLGSPNGLLSSSLGNFITDRDGNADGDKPKAFLTWILLDDRLNIVSSSSGSDQVGDNGIAKEHLVNEVEMEKNGYLFVYVSNASTTIPVYFDNLQVTYNKGRLLEETHYYPFGLTMAGISTKAVYSPVNKLKYNGKEEQRQEFADGSGLEWMDYGARMYDNQIGRWHVQDVFSQDAPGWTPYRYAFNNPLIYIDPDGKWEFQIRTDRNGNYYLTLVGQKGDNLQSLADQTGLDIDKLRNDFYIPPDEDNDGLDPTANWGEGTELTGLGSQFSFDGINNALNDAFTTGCNCWGTALEFGETGKVDNKGGIGHPKDADKRLNRNFTQTTTPKTGDIVRYATPDGYAKTDLDGNGNVNANNEAIRKSEGLPSKGTDIGGTSHFATYLLKNNSGLQVFTKNGWFAGWQVMYEKALPPSYGGQTGAGGGSAYYTLKKP